jgi:hypothetical protein
MKSKLLDDADPEYRSGTRVMQDMEADKPANQVAIAHTPSPVCLVTLATVIQKSRRMRRIQRPGCEFAVESYRISISIFVLDGIPVPDRPQPLPHGSRNRDSASIA